MSASQLSRDLRVVGVDLGCAALRVLVWGVAGVGSWLGRYRQDVVADRAQRILDAERLAEAEAERDVWEPHDSLPGCCTFHEPAEFGDGIEARNALAECGLEMCAEHLYVNTVDRPCPECFPVGVSSAGAGGGPEVVSGQPPASGQPTATQLLDHIDELIREHVMTAAKDSSYARMLRAAHPDYYLFCE